MNNRVMIALPSEQDREKARQILESNGYPDIQVVNNNLEMVLYCEKKPIDILLIDMTFPFMDCASTLRYIVDNGLARIIIAVDTDWEKNQSAMYLEWIDIFVTKPLESRKFIPALSVSLSRKDKMEELEQEYRKAKAELRNQKIFGYALQLAMDRMSLPEQEAKLYLDRIALEHGKDVKDIYEILYSVLCNKKSIKK